MKKCPKLAHTAKGRERALAYAESLTMLESNKKYTYKINHYYDIKPQDVFVETSIQPVVFELLLARILFEAAEIDESYGLGQEEIDKSILNKLYGVKLINQPVTTDENFDLYYTWEKWCSLFDKVMSLKVFDNEKLRLELEKIVPVGV